MYCVYVDLKLISSLTGAQAFFRVIQTLKMTRDLAIRAFPDDIMRICMIGFAQKNYEGNPLPISPMVVSVTSCAKPCEWKSNSMNGSVPLACLFEMLLVIYTLLLFPCFQYVRLSPRIPRTHC